MLEAGRVCLFLYLTTLLSSSFIETGFAEEILINEYCKSINVTYVICHGDDEMQKIPHLPDGTKILKIRNANFKRLTKDLLVNVSRSTVKELIIQRCKIQEVDDDAFSDLQHVKVVDLSKNIELKPEKLNGSLYSFDKTEIHHLKLNFMRWSWADIPSDMFNGLKYSKVTNISLNNNFITNFDGIVFQDLHGLRHLDLAFNGMSDTYNVTFRGLSQITKLNLRGNWYLTFPNFCNESNESFFPNLDYLNLAETKIHSLTASRLVCLEKLRYLDLSGLSLRLLYDNTFTGLPSLESLVLKQLGSQFRRVSKTAFNSSSLTKLFFSVSRVRFFTDHNAKNFHPKSIFKYSKKLVLVDISNNVKVNLSEINLYHMFSPLRKLETLKIKRSNIRELPKIRYGTFPALTELDLSSNKISEWNGSKLFHPFPKLQTLNLRDNDVKLINKTSFPKEWMDGTGTLRELKLLGNPFSCECKLAWFREWMDKEKNISIDSDKWYCSISKHKVLNYNPQSLFQCYLEYFVSAICSLLVILTLSFLLFIFRFRIKLAWYRCRPARNGYVRLSDFDQIYDCFIAYSYKDLKWVQDYLIPKMEEEHGIRLCIRDRDFILGTVFSNHIIENIRASRNVLLVLSDNFAKNVWCRFQLDIAHHLDITEGGLNIIPVILKEISFQNMTEPLYRVMKQKGYCTWSQNEIESEVFWKTLLDKVPSKNDENVYNSISHSIQSNESAIQISFRSDH